jgi:ribonuclease Z
MQLKAILLGTGVGIPQPGRSQSALLVQAERSLLLDCGAGTLLRLADAGVSVLDLDAVLLTHLHLDHVSDLLPLAKARHLLERRELEVWGPVGTMRWLIGLRGLYPYLAEMEVAVHELDPGDEVSLEGFKIITAEALHSVPALGYRIEHGSRALACSGDTEPCQEIAALAKGADLLVHECSFPEPFRVTNHSTPIRLGEIIRGVGRVVLTHFYPQCRGHEEEMARDVRAASGAEVMVGRDLMTVVV